MDGCKLILGDSQSCNAKEGNPFGPFWDTFHVNFVGSEFYSPLHYDVGNAVTVRQWQVQYPASKWPVLAFTGDIYSSCF